MDKRENSFRMTKADLYDWVVSQGCETKTLPEYKANVLLFVNPKTGNKGWIDLPIDDKPLRDYTICKVCCDLQIQLPTSTAYMKPLYDKIKKRIN